MLLQALENGISKVPNTAGRFPQVSGIQFQYNSMKEPGERIDTNTIRINGKDFSSQSVSKFTTLLSCMELFSQLNIVMSFAFKASQHK